MSVFRVALAQINVTVGDIEGNALKIIEYISRARGMGADLIAVPELAVTGYPPEDLVFKPQFVDDNRRALDRVIAESHGFTVVVGYVDYDGEAIYNAAAIAKDGELLDTYRKCLLPNYGVFDERRYFSPGNSAPVYPISDTLVGVNICEDIWSDTGPTSTQAAEGAALIVNINGSPYHRGKRSEREVMLSKRATDSGITIAYVNMVGGQDELVFDGGSMIIAPSGELMARAPQFRETLLVHDIPIQTLVSTRGEQEPPKINPTLKSARHKTSLSKAESSSLDDLAEVYQALVTGTHDYTLKAGFEKVIIALSGGIDSSLVAVIACDALGPERVVGLSLPSRYSSEGSVLDATSLAVNLGIELLSCSIESTFSAYLQTLNPLLEGTESSLTEENLQSRIRGDLVMALSNNFGYLALTTGNKSEYAVGYATLYGDMSGGFAVIKDVPKTLVYELSRYRNKISPAIPDAIIEKPPSAELRPDQLDSDSLPPYEVLDAILKAYVEDDLPYRKIVDLGHSAKTVREVICMVDRAEYKRRQSPPGVKITERNFGRDRRMPIINRYQPS